MNLCFCRSVDPGPQPVTTGNLRRNADIFEHRELWKNFGDLEGSGHAERHALMRGELGNVSAIERYGTGRWRKKPADQVEEGGLAGAIRPDDRAQFSLGHSH